MAARVDPAATLVVHARCRCGHFPTHHMVVQATGSGGNYRLEPSGPCALCGDSVCRRFTPAGA